MNLYELGQRMRRFNSQVAPGSTCAAWDDFVDESFWRFGCAPYSDDAMDCEIRTTHFAAYWLAVTAGNNDKYTVDGDRV